MMDILEALQIDIVLADRKRSQDKAPQAPIEITIDEDNDDFKNLTVEFERFPQSDATASQNPSKDAKETQAPKNCVQTNHRQAAVAPRPAEHSTKEASKGPVAGPSGLKSLVTPERLKPNQERNPTELKPNSASLKTAKGSTPGFELESARPLPQQQSTPKPPQVHRCQFCRKQLPFKITLGVHEDRCKMNPAQVLGKPTKQIPATSGGEATIGKFNLDESLETNSTTNEVELTNDLLEIKEESLRLDDTDLFPHIANQSSSSFSSANDSRSASFTASKNDQTFPAAKKESKDGARLNLTAPAQLKNPTVGQTPVRLVENWKDHPVPIAEIVVCGPSRSKAETKEAATVVKTEPAVAPVNESRKLDCPMCFKTQGSPKGMLTHLINFHFKYLSNKNVWACLKCSKTVTQKSEVVAHAISCHDRPAPKVDRQPPATAKPAPKLNKSVCNQCGGYAGNLNFKRKRKCGECGPCKIQKCNTCKFCRKPTMKKPCERKACLNPIYPKCMCPSKK